ncbi:carboxypeptidase regulatory-like domain-containing protein [Pyxidicoccus sp. 3LG]
MGLRLLTLLLLFLPVVALGSQVEGTLLDVKQRPLVRKVLEVLHAHDGTVAARHKSGPGGRFTLELLPGRYLLRVGHPESCAGHEDAVAVEVKEAEDVAGLQVVLRRCVSVTGHAFGLDGAPLAHGTVTMRWKGLPEPRWTATTDEAGRFVLPRAPQGQVEVFLKDAAGTELMSETRMSVPRQLEVRARRAHRVLVRGPDGAPLPEAVVALVPEPRHGVTLEALTDARGFVGLPTQLPGRYRLLAYWEQEDQFFRYVWKDVALGPENEAVPPELSFAERPSSGTLSGRALSADMHPVANATVTAIQSFPSVPLDDGFLRDSAYPLESATTRTDDEGRFTLRDLREGEYRLVVEHPAGIDTSLRARTGGSAAELVLPPACAKSVSGRVVDTRGKPITGFQVDHQESADPAGRFTHRGGCHILIAANGFMPRWVSLPASSLAHVELPDIELQPGRNLVGRLVHPDGKPAAEHGLVMSWTGDIWPPGQQSTDAAGRFSVGPAPVDTEVVLEAPAAGQVPRYRIPPGAKGELTLRLPRLDSRLSVRGTSENSRPLKGIHVTARSRAGSFSASANDSDRVLLRVPPGTYEVRVSEETERDEAWDGVPHRFTPLKVQVSRKGTATLVARAARGSGALRVLLQRPSHYDDVYVLPGVHPWPSHISTLDSSMERLEADTIVDTRVEVGAPREVSIFSHRALSDFTGLPPGRYTVFATNSYGLGGTIGRSTLFREVIEVDGKQRQLVQVRFEGEDLRELPW